MSRGPIDTDLSGRLDAVTASGLARLLEEAAGKDHEKVALELAARTIRGRRVLQQFKRLAEVTGRDTSWSYLRKLTERVEHLAELEEMPKVGAPRGAAERKCCQHFLSAAEILSEEHDLRKRGRLERVARWLRKMLADEVPEKETEWR